MRRVKSPVDRWRLLVSGPGGRHKRARPLNNRATLDERLKVLSHRPSLFQPGDWCPTVRQAARRIRKILHPVQTCPARRLQLERPSIPFVLLDQLSQLWLVNPVANLSSFKFEIFFFFLFSIALGSSLHKQELFFLSFYFSFPCDWIDSTIITLPV